MSARRTLGRAVLIGLLIAAAVPATHALGPVVAAAGQEVGQEAGQQAEQARATSISGVYLTTGRGTSMEPTMGPGDRALCVAHVEPEIGSVVAVDGAALGNSNDVRHRVVEMNGTHVVTKGDNRDSRDDPVSREAVRCTVVYAEGAGWWP